MSAGDRVVLLASDGASTRMVFHALQQDFPDLHVVLERSVYRARLLRRRIRTLGPVTVIGQVAFMGLIRPVLKARARDRIHSIKEQYGLIDDPIPEPIRHVESVNDQATRTALRHLDPAVVVVNGTRIIRPPTLSTLSCPVINTHAGITPLYRGVHGGYWALADGRPELAGTTVHLVDEGIDTGKIISQATLAITPEDSFVTYPYLHTAAGISILLEAVRAGLRGTLRCLPEVPELPSRLRTHPTAWGYMRRRVLHGVR